jgi:hypothetical protein
MALNTASILDQQAKVIDNLKWKEIRKRIGYKAFWQQAPLALLCLELQVPNQVAYNELSQLTGVALRAWNRSDTDNSFSPDALRKRYERFYKRQAGLGGLALLIAFLKIIEPPD